MNSPLPFARALFYSGLPLLGLLLVPEASAYRAGSTSGNVPTSNPDGNRCYSYVFPNGASPGDGADGSKQGDPINFTWSIVPDGTSFYTGISNTGTERISAIISYYDGVFSVPVAEQTADLTNRPWFPGFSEGLDIISNRCGVTYIYEPVDDGVDCILSYPSSGETDAGAAGARGDLRIAASSDLFAGGLSTTGAGDRHHPEIYLKLQSFNSNNSIRFVVMHEALHALGFGHSTVNGTANQSAVTGAGGTSNGPQFDDICGLHRKYGDFFEKGVGNDTLANATDLGSIDTFETLIIGDDADDTTVALNEFDFISIDGASDTDFLKFSVASTGEFTLTLDPRGPTYTNYSTDWSASFIANNTTTIVADELNDLEFELYDSSGTLLDTASSVGLGESEVLVATLTAGDYFAKINGTTNDPTITHVNGQIAGAQLYAFEVKSNQLPPATADDNSLITDEDTPANILLTGNDPAGSPLIYTIVTPPSNGALSGTAPNLTYTPDSDFFGSDSFTFTLNDSAIATISITVNPVNDPPTPNDDSVTTLQGSPVDITLTGNDAEQDSLTYLIITPPTNGVLSGTAPNLTYTPNQNYNGPDSFTYVVNDGSLTSLYEAEDTLFSSAQVKTHAGASNETYLDGNGNMNVTWSVSHPGGPTQLDFRIKVPNLTRSLGVFIDNVQAGVITSSSTSWETQSLTVQLSSGINAIELRDSEGTAEPDIDFLYVPLPEGTISINVDPLSGYAAWIAGSSGITDASFEADPDGDGVPNGIEYVLNRDPATQDALCFDFESSEPDVVLNFDRNADSLSDTTQIFQYSNDLQTWTDLNLTGTIAPEVTLGTASGGLQPITITIDNGPPSYEHLFWRLKVEFNE